MYFIQKQRRMEAFKNRQLAPYLPPEGPPIKGNVLVVKVHDFQGAMDIEETETRELTDLVIL